MRFVTKGIVLRETDIKETDKLLTVLLQTGEKRTVLARRARSKGSRLAASAQLLVFSDMTLFEYRDYFTLDEASTIEQFYGIRSDLEKLALGCYFAELCELFAEGDCAPPWLLSLLLNALFALDKLKKDPNLIKPAFEMKLMSLAGFAPLLDECCVCGKSPPEQPRLSLREGTVRCANCPLRGRRRYFHAAVRGEPCSPAPYPIMRPETALFLPLVRACSAPYGKRERSFCAGAVGAGL